MADEAFALSPISARAAQPREEDYDAINEAFMETSRGRWFLGEYAKRNRNADTRMVLDAVARIEVTMAAQKQPVPEPDNGLADALVAIRSAVEQARISALAALDNHMLEEALAPIRKGARIVKEIAWRWREIGADPRICDLLDSQVGAIEAGCEQVASHDPLTALSAAFDLLEGRIRQIDGSDATPAEAEAEAVVSPASPPPSDEMPAAAEEAAEAAAVMDDTEDAVRAEAMRAEAAAASTETADVTADVDMATEAAAVAIETSDVMVEAPDAPAAAADAVAETADMTEAADVMVEAVDVPAEAADIPAEVEDTDQDAVLDMVAFAMAAPDPADADEAADPVNDEAHVTEQQPAEPDPIAMPELEPEPEQTASPAIAPTMQPSIEASLEPAIETSTKAPIEALTEASAEASLGSSLLANGIVRRPLGASDPLTPIRRLSQAEKIALFS
jgi:hypothetical protein